MRGLKYMVGLQHDYNKTAELLDKALDMFGVKSVFDLFGVDKKKWIKYYDPFAIMPIYISPGVYYYPPK